jgi:hypothetical protein
MMTSAAVKTAGVGASMIRAANITASVVRRILLRTVVMGFVVGSRVTVVGI